MRRNTSKDRTIERIEFGDPLYAEFYQAKAPGSRDKYHIVVFDRGLAANEINPIVEFHSYSRWPDALLCWDKVCRHYMFDPDN